MADTISLVQADTGPDIDITLIDRANNNAPIDVSGSAVVVMYFRKKGSAVLTSTITLTKPNGGSDGIVRVVWPVGALAASGFYNGEIELTTAVGKIITMYDELIFYVRPQLQV